MSEDSNPRARRVGAEIQRALSMILTRFIRDPRLEMVTITEVRMSRDLKNAKVYFSISGSEVSKDVAEKALIQAKGFIKKCLAKEIYLRYMPSLAFIYDTSFDRASVIHRALKELDPDTKGSE